MRNQFEFDIEALESGKRKGFPLPDLTPQAVGNGMLTNLRVPPHCIRSGELTAAESRLSDVRKRCSALWAEAVCRILPILCS